MDGIGAVITGIVDVGLAPTLVILFVWKGFGLAQKFLKQLYELQIGQRIIMSKLNAVEEYENAIKELKAREKDE